MKARDLTASELSLLLRVIPRKLGADDPAELLTILQILENHGLLWISPSTDSITLHMPRFRGGTVRVLRHSLSEQQELSRFGRVDL